ncbi:TetR/AcrR family transcriptional regulator [Natronocella acetinitrilica]|uniref:TetR/AcrR family transcriptional regulator n=1 Tax=Natronocella acetinitrilica TaxID=414046 RepID=A0AAE3G8B6_9GAMM|nr:TetR/AcrR family transcriptional regulator [Natronocella acetinitrilica]MCP1676859.1 TetR/AcrR family transcriptional regulator [Natronocella acetinitrilica]
MPPVALSSESARPPSTQACQRILAAAKLLFGQRGYDGVSIRDVAQMAKASKANVFHHFGSKAGLYSAVLEDTSSAFQAILDSFDAAQQTPRQRISDFARRNLETMLADPASVHLFLRQMLNGRGNSQRQQAEELIARDLNQLLARIRDETSTGLPRSSHVDPLVLLLCILGANFMYFQLQDVLPQLRNAEQPLDQDRFIGALMQLLETSLDGR